MIPENGTPVYHGGRLIGTIHRGELQQTRRPNAFMRWGIAFDVGVLAEVERAGADRVRVKNGETGATYTASIAAIRKLGKPINHGHGAQIALAYGHWQRTGASTRSPETAQPEPQPRAAQPEPAQLALFGGAI